MNNAGKIIGIILASGSGTRMNTILPKQFIDIGGKPMFMRSLELFLEERLIDFVVLTSPSTGLDFVKNTVGEDERVRVIVGGQTREESLEKALSYSIDSFGEDVYTITHDAARPFLSKDILGSHVEMAFSSTICTTAVNSVDTVALADENGIISMMPDRKTCYSIQTPQSFPATDYFKAKALIPEIGCHEITDAAKVFLLAGYDVKIIKGSPDNFKVTYPGDLKGISIE